MLQRSGNTQLVVRPSPNNLLDYHFILHSLPSDSPYAGGCFHGKLCFPQAFPNAPPKIVMITPNGRLEEDQPLCVTMSDFMPGSWNPAWSIETILVGLISFMLDDSEKHFVGAMWRPKAWRQSLAKKSWSFNANDPEFVELFPDWCSPPSDVPSVSTTSETAPRTTDSFADQVPTERIPEQLVSVSAERQVPPLGHQTERKLQFSGVRNYLGSPFRLRQDATTGHSGAFQQAVANAEEVRSDQAQQVPLTEEDPNDLPECGICGLLGDEPLIQPCACRGTMAGMHASCLHVWIRRHRQWEGESGGPRCGVCGQEYKGYDVKPGFFAFIRHHCALLPNGILSLLSVLFSIVKLGVFLEAYALFLEPKHNIMLWLGDPVLFGSFYLYFLQRVMMVVLPPLSDGINNANVLRFFVARDHNQVSVASVEVELLQFGAFFLSIKQCFDNKPAFCMLKEKQHGMITEHILPYHDCQQRLFQDNLRVYWFLPHKVQIVDYLPHMSLILFALPAFILSDASYVFASFGDEQRMSWRLAKELMVRLIRLLGLFVAIPVFVLVWAPVLPYMRNHAYQSEFHHILNEELLLWFNALILMTAFFISISPCLAFWYYRRWQYRNGNFTLSEPLLAQSQAQ